jgi:hypothetical protein
MPTRDRTAPRAEFAPDPRAKFEAKGVEGDITKVVGGATAKPIPPAPKKIEPKGAPRRARTLAACSKPSAARSRRSRRGNRAKNDWSYHGFSTRAAKIEDTG